ncbi:MAG: 50S ribosomal protein L4 [Microgenomates group bacterium]
MPKVDLFDTKGNIVGKFELPKEIFGIKDPKPELIAQAVRVYLANQRKAGAKVKTRSEVNRTKSKWYRQKGTGRARHGSRSAPIFVGGGVAHGPTGEENYKLEMPKKMRRKALFSALTLKLKDKEILVVKGVEKIKPKTKEMWEILKNLKIFTPKSSPKTLLVLPQILENIILSARNIENMDILLAENLNTYQVLSHRYLVFLPESVEKLKEVFLKKNGS